MKLRTFMVALTILAATTSSAFAENNITTIFVGKVDNSPSRAEIASERCTQFGQGFCCFDSQMAKLVNEQAEKELTVGDMGGKCGGFTLEEFERLNFEEMDLSEFTNKATQQTKSMNEGQVSSGAKESVGAVEHINTASPAQKITSYIPVGALSATMITGVLAPTGYTGKGNPVPIIFRLKSESCQQVLHTTATDSCFVVGEGVGNIAAAQVDIRLSTLHCNDKDDNTAIDEPIKGFIEGPTGKAGVPGKVVSTTWAINLRKAVDDAKAEMKTYVKNEALADLQTEMLHQSLPVIEVPSHQEVTVWLTSGVVVHHNKVNAQIAVANIEDFKTDLENAKLIAIDDPTNKEKVRKYVELNDLARNKALQFTNTMQQVRAVLSQDKTP